MSHTILNSGFLQHKSTKTAIKRENGLDFPPRDYAYVPDPMRPATWRLRLTETPGQMSVAQLQRAAAALSPAGFRGNRLELPPAAATSVKRRLLAEFRRMKVGEHQIPASVKESVGQDFLVWKDANDRTRWFAVYSNNFLDDDNPREIIAVKSHERFVEMVDMGLVDFPELWLWHVPGTAWGKADWVACDEGFALASGYVYPGFEGVAEGVSKMKDVRLSHGMIEPMLVYDPNDKRVIIFHITHEISVLPSWAAANKMTGFAIVGKGESDMALPDAKKEFIKDAGLMPSVISRIESSLKSTREAAQAAGLEFKEGDAGEDPAAEASEDAVAAEADAGEETEAEPAAATKNMTPADDAEDSKKKPKPKKPAKEASQEQFDPALYVLRDEAIEAIAAVAGPLVEAVQELRADREADRALIASMTKEIAALKASDEEKIAATKEVTPTASLTELLMRQIPIGSKEARVDGRSALKEEGPKETAAPAARSLTLVPLIDDLQAQSVTPRKSA